MANDETPTVYTWDLDAPGPSGVAVERDRAIERLNEALSEVAPGVQGVVTEVHLPTISGCYIPVRVVAWAHRDAATGAIVWADALMDASPSQHTEPGL